MGAKFSLSLANIYMAWWEKDDIFDVSNPFFRSIIWYGHYIGDLIIIWGSGVAAIPDFLSYLNYNGLLWITMWILLRFLTILSARSGHPMHKISPYWGDDACKEKWHCTSEVG